MSANGEGDKNSGNTTPSLTTVTTNSVVATFALETISSYASLRQSITTTFTVTTTASDGKTGLETAAAVIAAGGVAFFLAGVAGDLASAEEVLEAPSPPEDGHEDDPKCPGTKTKCSDCAGTGGMCTTGDNVGCACDGNACPPTKPKCSDCDGKDGKCATGDNKGCDCDQSCPTGDQQPKCSDDKCNGDDQNKCTIDNKNCDCTPDETCPEDEDTLFCSDCGGSNNDEKCKGLGDQNGKYKDCYCIDSSNYPPEIGPDDPSDQEVLQAINSLPAYTPESYSLGLNEHLDCQHAGLGAPQRDSDGKPSVQSSINDWCASVDGQKVHKAPNGVDRVFKMYPVHYYSYWLSASNWYDAPGGNKCGDEATISKDECIEGLTEARDRCDPNSGTTMGGSFSTSCTTYSITMDGSQKPDSPPWNPLPTEALSGACDRSQSSGISYLFWSGIYPAFCAAVDKDPKAHTTERYTQNDFKQPSQSRSLRLKPRTPPAGPGQYPPKYLQNYYFNFEFSGAKGDCRKSCSDAMGILAGSCGHTGGEQNALALSSTFDAGCGKYTASIDLPDPEKAWCDYPDSYNEGYEPYPFSVDAVGPDIENFCGDSQAHVSNPPEAAGFHGFIQNIFEYKGPWPHRFYQHGDVQIELWAQFQDTTTDEKLDCTNPDKEFHLSDYKEQCKKVLWKAVNGCNTGTTTAKKSSIVTENDGANGCVIWMVRGSKVQGSSDNNQANKAVSLNKANANIKFPPLGPA